MKLPRRTIDAITVAVVSVDEIREIRTHIAAEEQFQTYVVHLRMLIAGVTEELSGIRTCEMDQTRGHGCLATRRREAGYHMQERLTSLEEELQQCMKQCLHWTQWSNGRCRVCGVKA